MKKRTLHIEVAATRGKEKRRPAIDEDADGGDGDHDARWRPAPDA